MSYNWSFYSFEYSKFLTHIVTPNTKYAKENIAAALDDARKWAKTKELEKFEVMARHILKNGFDYHGLKNNEAKLLDYYLSELMGHADIIDNQAESPDFLGNQVTFDILVRSEGSRPPGLFNFFKKYEKRDIDFQVLPYFQGGRRWGEQQSSHCEYVILNTPEIEMLRQELERELVYDAKWHNEWIEEHIVECFLTPIIKTLEKNKALYASLG